MPSISLQRFNALSILDSSKILAGSRRRVTTASSVTLKDSKRSILTPPLTISERSQINVGSQLSSGSTNHSNDQGIPRGLPSPHIPYSALEIKEDSRDEPPQSQRRDDSSAPVGSIHIHKNSHDVSDATLDSGLAQSPKQKLTSESQPSFKENDLPPPPRQKIDGGYVQRHNSYSRKPFDKTYYSGETDMRQSPESAKYPSSHGGGDADKVVGNIVAATLIDAEKNRRESNNHGFVVGDKVVDDIVAATLMLAEKSRSESGNQGFVARGSDKLSQPARKLDRSKSMPNRSTKKARPKHNISAPARIRIHKNDPDTVAKKAASKHSSSAPIQLSRIHKSRRDSNTKLNYPTSEFHCRSSSSSESTLEKIMTATGFPPPIPFHLSSKTKSSQRDEGSGNIYTADTTQAAALANVDMTHMESDNRTTSSKSECISMTFSQELQLLHGTQPKSKRMPHRSISDSENQQRQQSLQTSAAMADMPSSARSSLDESDDYKRPFVPSLGSESSNTVEELVADALLRVQVLLEGSD